jgi:hypothetical protein
MFMSEPGTFFRRRNIQVGRAPRNVLFKARRIIERLEKGQPYWKLRGKRLQYDRQRISIPLGPHWRILADDINGQLVVREVLSHQSYNIRHP